MHYYTGMTVSFSPLLLLAGIPLVFLPFTQDVYETNKWYAVLLVALVTAIIWGVSAIKTKTLTLRPSRTFWALLLLSAAGIVSLLVASPNKIEAALSPFGPALFAGLAIIVLLAPRTKFLLTLLLHSISFLSLLAILQMSGVLTKLAGGIPWLADPLWTPVGGSLTLAALALIMIPIAIQKVRIETPFLLAGAVGTLAVALPKLPSALLPPWAGWQIMLEAFKRFPGTLVGVGPENFLSAFTIGRPAYLNMTAVWNTRFLANSNTFLHLGTTTGIVGLLAVGYVLWILAPRSLKTALDWARLFSVVALFLIPPSVSLLTVFVILLAASEQEEHVMHRKNPGLAISLGVVALIGALGIGSLLIRAYRAELTFFRAYLTAQEANGGLIQRTGQKAITLNPYIARYHEAYAQTNLILAAAIASESDADRDAVAQLISQAIREGKLATQLAPAQVTTWETLGRLYQNIIGVADAADTWAIASYQKAVELDPTNPGLRLELGSIYLAQKNYDAAIAHFAVAVALKPDLANAQYNLGNAYRQKGNLPAAREALLRTQALLTEGTDDYEKISDEITALDAEEEPLPASAPSP